jgi:hypothetical protein
MVGLPLCCEWGFKSGAAPFGAANRLAVGVTPVGRRRWAEAPAAGLSA